MNLDQIKTEWQHFNNKLTLSKRLNEQLILSMLKERSRSRVSKVRRDNLLYLALMVIVLAFLAAIFGGNPFDFRYTLQYLPYGILAIGVLMAIYSLVKSLQSFDVNVNKINLDAFLKRIIDGYEKNRKIEKWFGAIILSAGCLTAFSFLPKKLEHKSMLQALGETALSICITLLMYFVAFKLGAFKNRKRDEFENDLRELNELKAISSELED